MSAELTHRIATPADLPALSALMAEAIDELQKGFLSPEQIASSRMIMGLDSQLVADGTYFVVEQDGALDHAEFGSNRSEFEKRDRFLELERVAGGKPLRTFPQPVLAGCGGWSRRDTLYGGDHTPGREPRLLDPATEPARVRAMYTSPAFARRGVGRLILALCEAAAKAEGFQRLELAATLSGQPLYEAYGFTPIQAFEDDRGGVAVPLIRMGKRVE